MKKFKVGTVYYKSFITDTKLKPEYICIKRTEKTVTFKKNGLPNKGRENEELKRTIKIYDQVEYIKEGSFSMAPTISADNIVK